MARVNIADVAVKAGISKSTVSNYLNHHFEKLSPKTRALIRSTIEELNYSPRLSAQLLSRKESPRTIGIILEQTSVTDIFSTLFFSTVMQGIKKGLEEFGYRALLVTSKDNDPRLEVAYAKSLADIVDGFMIFNIQEMDLYVEEFERSGILYVCVGKIIGEDSHKYVATDYRDGIRKGMAHLLELGHRDIALVTGRPGSIVSVQMKQGYMSALKEAGIKFRSPLLIETQSDTEDLFDVADKLIDSQHVTAFIVGQPQAVGIHKAIEKHNLCVPSDISILLCQHYAASAYEKYEYTYLEAPLYTVGYNAVARFDEYREHGADSKAGDLVFPMKLVKGKTTFDAPNTQKL